MAPTREVFAQVASALDAAHAEGLVHRDVKPGNVLLEPSGPGRAWHAYLADFGLTKHAGADSGLTSTGEVLGTAFYVAPEQVEGKEVDGRADQYSLSCVLFECLTGHRPFDPDGQLLAILAAHAQASRPRVSDHRPDLPAEIDVVIARALAVDPDERFATCSEFVAAAAEALGVNVDAGGAAGATSAPVGEPEPDEGAETAPATATGLLPRPLKPSGNDHEAGGGDRRRQRPAAAVLGAVALVVLAAVTLVWLQPDDDSVSGIEEQAGANTDEDTADEDAFNIELGDTVSPGAPGEGAGELEHIGAADVYEFEASEGDRVVVETLSVGDDPRCGGDHSLNVALHDPREERLSDLGGDSLGSQPCNNLVYDIEATGVHQLTIFGSNDQTGVDTYRISLSAPARD